jgi:hypothetical protein
MTVEVTLELPPFQEFPSISRLSREMIVSEKLDGTNASVTILPDDRILVGSRTRWITPQDDNYGFARWVFENEAEVRKLGYGTHFGEWWGQGIQRKYGLTEKRFSLFNVSRWTSLHNTTPTAVFPGEHDTRCIEVPICHVVPVMLRCTFDTTAVNDMLTRLETYGSIAAPGFMKPEGVVVFHVASQALFKKTLEKDSGKFSAQK